MKHIGTAIAQAVRSIPNAPLPVQEAARLSAVAGRAYEIATYHQVAAWAGLIAETDADIREDVREHLASMYRNRQRDAALQARVDAGVDVVIEIHDNGKKRA